MKWALALALAIGFSGCIKEAQWNATIAVERPERQPVNLYILDCSDGKIPSCAIQQSFKELSTSDEIQASGHGNLYLRISWAHSGENGARNYYEIKPEKGVVAGAVVLKNDVLTFTLDQGQITEETKIMLE